MIFLIRVSKLSHSLRHSKEDSKPRLKTGIVPYKLKIVKVIYLYIKDDKSSFLKYLRLQ